MGAKNPKGRGTLSFYRQATRRHFRLTFSLPWFGKPEIRIRGSFGAIRESNRSQPRRPKGAS